MEAKLVESVLMLQQKPAQGSFYGGYGHVHQDHLTGTSVITNQNGDTVIGSIRYMPFGAARAVTGTIETEVKFIPMRRDLTTLQEA